MAAACRTFRTAEAGRSLPAALIALAVGSLLLTPFLSFVSSRSLGTRAVQETFQAQYAADAGIEYGIWALLNDPAVRTQVDSSPGNPVVVPFPESINGYTPSLTITALLSGLQWLEEPPAGPPDPAENIGAGGALEYDGGNAVYALIGNDTRSFYRYSIQNDSWTALDSLPGITLTFQPLRIYFLSIDAGSDLVYTGTGSNDLYALVEGIPLFGQDKDFLFRYSIANPGWQNVTETPQEFESGAALVYGGSSTLYAFQGGNKFFWRYDSGGWEKMRNAPDNTGAGAALVYTGGNFIYAFPGGGSDEFWRYEIDNNKGEWTVLSDQAGGALPGAVTGGGSLAYDGNDTLYALQGGSSGFWQYTISTNTWTVSTDTPASTGAGGDLALVSEDSGYALRGGNQDDYWKLQLTSTRYDLDAQAGSVETSARMEIDGGGAAVLFWDIK